MTLKLSQFATFLSNNEALDRVQKNVALALDPIVKLLHTATFPNLKDNTRAYARAVISSGQSIPNNTRTVIAWNRVILDSRGAFSGLGSSSFRFTAPEPGIHLVSACVGLNSSGTQGNVWLYVHKNGSASAYSLLDYESGPYAASFEFVSGTDLIRLEAGEYIDIRINQAQSAGSAARLVDTNTEASWVNIVRLVTDL
jgi:hypothetical protein